MSTAANPATIRHRIWTLAEPLCRHAGYDLVDVRFTLEQGGWVLRVSIDVDPAQVPADRVPGPDGMTPDLVDLNDCERISRELSAALDVADPIPQAYSLEVSSPGIDRPLVTVAHFQRFVGAEIRVTLERGVPTPQGSERKNFRGILDGVEVDGDPTHALARIIVDGQPWRFPIADVDVAKIVPDWEVVMKGGRGQVRTAADTAAAGRPGKPGHPGDPRRPGKPRQPGKPNRPGKAPHR